MIKKLKITLKQESHIYFLADFLSKPPIGLIKDWQKSQSIFIFIDSNLKSFYSKKIKRIFKDFLIPCFYIYIKVKEESKSIKTWFKIQKYLLYKKANKGSHFIVLGGGILSDLIAFVASTYYRGISFTLIPSSFLAQIDSALGGKTSIHIDNTKNLIGTIQLAKNIIIDPFFLKTLPLEHYIDGFSELIKYAIIHDESFYTEIIQEQKNLLQKKISLLKLKKWILKACNIKCFFIKKDPLDKNLRQILNFGHTIAHALEKASSFSLSHGKALSLGILIELSIAHEIKGFDNKIIFELENFFYYLGLPIKIPDSISLKDILYALEYDKKIRSYKENKIPFILPKKVGRMGKNYIEDIEKNIIKKHLKKYF